MGRCAALRRAAPPSELFGAVVSIAAGLVRPRGMNAFADPVFQAYTLAASATIVLLYALGFLTAKTRAERKIVLNPEDVSVNSGSKVGEVEHPDVLRIKRAHLNLLETAVPFFAIGFLYTATAPSVTLARVLFGAFVVVRVLHAVFYLGAKQPFRTIMFAGGTLVNVIMLVQVMRTLLPAMF
jgi:prostaglandin-E synthase 1